MTNGEPQLPPLKKLRIPPRAELSRKPLTTERLVLEPIVTGMHQKLFLAVDQSRAFLEPWLPWVPFNKSLDASFCYAAACETDWDAGSALRFSIRRRHEAPLLGVVTLEGCTALHRSCDLGYWLRPDATGQGYMTEAAGYLIEFCFETLGIHRIRCAAAVDNPRSRRVIERLGFSFEGTAREAERVGERFVSHAVYGRLASDPAPSLAFSAQGT